jgi:AcrR family transcriptional regulator
MVAALISSRIRKPRGQGATRRAEILIAAQRLFLEQGFEHTTMRRLADAVGVSATALYVYFADKDAILRAIAEVTFAEMLAVLEASQRVEMTPLERFRAGLHAYVAFGRARPDAYRLTFLAKLISPASPGRRALDCTEFEAANRSFDIMERGVAELMQSGQFRPGDPHLVAEALWASLHGVTALLIDLSIHLDSKPDLLVDTVLDIAIRGLTS